MTQQTSPTGYFRPVGTDSFGDTRKPPRAFDQQPLEAAATISACLAAWRADGDAEWKADATQRLRLVPRQQRSVGCRSSISRPAVAATDCIPTAPTRTAAASSVVSYLLGLAEIRQLARVNADPTNSAGASRRRRLIPAISLRANRGHLVASHVSEPAGALSAPRSRARDRAPVQAGDRAARPQPHRQDARQSYRRPGARARSRGGGQPAGRRAREFRGPAPQPAGDVRGRAPTKWKTPSRRTAPFTKMQRQLVGAYFLHEYSFEASALFNPSIVAASRPVAARRRAACASSSASAPSAKDTCRR